MFGRTEYLNKPPNSSDFHTALAKVSNDHENVTFLAYGENREEAYEIISEAIEQFDGTLHHIETT